ncbi:histidine phosphatase family protein [Sphaerisporangium album]|uniref:Histidine phosphatase family protein n=1 Tax=Sphaerisporangium album TaxID=509200 RepID=A0A367EXH0_9ACTN|nr:histidine phosphatase family protein [Sphaerisporangium album]RCG22773.1 histidine phosphatase family protein [Sphaerisporangium album]
MTARIVLICHASTDALRRAAFPLDEALNDQGLRQLATATPLFAPATPLPTAPDPLFATAPLPSATPPADDAPERPGEHAASTDARNDPAPRDTRDGTTPGNVGKVLCGPSRRCLQTASGLGLAAEPVEALRDWDAGRWAGRTLAEVQAERPEDVLTWLTDPASAPHGGESTLAVVHRVATWLATLHDAGRTTAITHPAVIRAAVTHVLAAPPQAFWKIDVPPLAQVTLTSDNHRWHLRLTTT